MVYLIILLIIIIIFLSLYLFFINKELRRIRKSLKKIKSTTSNRLINQEFNNKEISLVINEINNLLKMSQENKIIFENKNLKLKKMITNISHDLRTPLTSALGYIDLIQNSTLNAIEKEKSIKVINERLKRLEELVNSFFELSKVIQEDRNPELTDVNIIALLEESIASYYEDYERESRKIIFNCNLKKVIIPSNYEMLKRVFDNLIGNAYKHSTDDLEINVTKSESLEIIFKNNLEYLNLDIDHVFDEFYTVDISRTKGNTGLGLAIVKEFIKNLGGSIKAEKKDNKFSIIIKL